MEPSSTLAGPWLIDAQGRAACVAALPSHLPFASPSLLQVLFDFMLYLHSSLGGCEPGHCSTVMSPPPEAPLPPGSLGRAHTHPPRPPHPPVPCGEYLPQPCPVDMSVVTSSLLFGLVTGAAGMWYVLKAK